MKQKYSIAMCLTRIHKSWQKLSHVELLLISTIRLCLSECVWNMKSLAKWFLKTIHRKQMWRTVRSSPGTSCMKASLLRHSYVLTILLQKSLVSSSIWSTLFRCAYELLCLWMLREGIELFHRLPRELRENSGDERKEFTFAAKLKFVRYISG